MKKLIALLSVGMLIPILTGCLGDDPVGATSITITIESIGAVVVGGAAGAVTGDIKADADLTNVTMAVLDGSGNDVTTTFSVNYTSAYTGKKKVDLKDDLSTTVGAKTGVAAGTYKLQITAASGSYESVASKEFTVTGGGTPVAINTIQAGANQNATIGSSIDLDQPKVMLKAEADQNVSKIDVCYAYSGVDNIEKLFSPHHAKASNFTFAKDWANPNQTKFYDTKLTPAQFTAIKTKEALAQIWQEPSEAATSVDCKKDNVFIAKTDQGALVLMHISAQVAGATGTIDMKVAK